MTAIRRKAYPLRFFRTLLLTGLCATALHADVIVYDTTAPLSPSADLADRARWTPVPPDLLQLEADPVKSASDPGYYGRPYEFAAATVVTNDHYTIVAAPHTPAVVVHSNASGHPRPLTLAPQVDSRGAPVGRVSLIRNTPDQAVLDISFLAANRSLTMRLWIDRTRVITYQRVSNGQMTGLEIACSLAYAIVPDFVADDLILSAESANLSDPIHPPADNTLIGLFVGGDAMLVLTSPDTLDPVLHTPNAAFFNTISLSPGADTVSLAILEAPGIWHREIFKPAHLEKDVESAWRPPFGARWITQLDEAGVLTRYTFRTFDGTVWRGAFGSYHYPLRFDGDTAVYHMSKKIPPKGQSIVYFLEAAAGTPTPTPADIIKSTLGHSLANEILDPDGRAPRTHHRRGAVGVRRACTCGGTEAIEAVFKANQHTQRAEYVRGIVDDMAFFVTEHVNRIAQYQDMARDMATYLDGVRGHEDFIAETKPIVDQIPAEQTNRIEQIKSLDFMEGLVDKTKALTADPNPKALEDCLDLCKQWRDMGGAQDDLLAQCHRLTRMLFNHAGRACLTDPESLGITREIRRRCRLILRNPDGYEIWPNY